MQWLVDGRPTHRMSAGAVAEDMGPTGAMIGQRLIPEEPMAIILNLGISRECFPFLRPCTLLPLSFTFCDPRRARGVSGIGHWMWMRTSKCVWLTVLTANWQDINVGTLAFPAEMTIDYVRVYQRKDEINIGCNPERYPTKTYIDDHLDAYSGEFAVRVVRSRESGVLEWTLNSPVFLPA